MKHLLIILTLFTCLTADAQKKAGQRKTVKTVRDTNIIFTKPEIEARFKGNFVRFIEKNLKYPDSTDCAGTVILEFIVELNGTIKNIRVADKSPAKCPTLVNPYKKIIEKSNGMWRPAIHHGKPVRSWHRQSIIIDVAEEE